METSEKKVSVVGLGPMGVKIAQLYLKAGYQVTVFNRTASKANQLINDGAKFTPDIVEAVKASQLIIVIVHNYQVSKEIFSSKDVQIALAGKSLVQLTTGTAEEAREGEQWFSDLHAAYIEGAIQVAPEQMAQPDTTILLSGRRLVYFQIQEDLKILGGNLKYLGENIGAASAMDTATLSYIYGAAIGFLHGALISEAEGFDVKEYGAIVAEIAPGMGEFLKHEGNVIGTGDFTLSQSPLAISVGATERILATAAASGINTEFPAFAFDWLKRAETAGFADQEFAAIIKILRKQP